MMFILSSQIVFPGRLRITDFVFKMTNLGAMKSQFNSFNFTFTFHFILQTLPISHMPHNIRACLHGGGGPQLGEVPALVGNLPVHIISHFNLITFT